MPNDGQIIFEVTADGKKAVANIKDITDAIKAEAKKWDTEAAKGTDSIENSFASMAKKVVAGLSAAKVAQTLLEWGKAAVEAASDLAEVQNVVDVTFGDNAAQIERWAKNAGTQFGLTETKAKQFASTLGAMMKSAGMTGNEIVTMSTDLAGLAADMASFYNLDFDTAFQKIRSGISGETEPLKQLGINMSVANLEAYALQQGLEKTFNEMTQGEQTLLRYQYLMQATADAQGDFSRTSDGYANSMRRVEAAIDSLKTKLGTVLLPVIEDITNGLAGLLENLTSTGNRTVMDDIAEIEFDAAGKIAQIEETAQNARELVQILEGIRDNKASDNLQKVVNGLTSVKLDQRDSGIVNGFLSTLVANIDALAEVRGESVEGAKEWLSGLAEKANSLDPNNVQGWKDLIAEITNGIPGLENTDAGAKLLQNLKDIGNTKAAGKIEEIGKKLNELDTSNGKAEAVAGLLGTLKENIEGIAEATGNDVSSVTEWLTGVEEAASQLTEDDVKGWETLAGLLETGLPGITESGAGFFESLGLAGVGGEVSQAAGYLEALGIETSTVNDKQALWLETCKRLVQTIPGLNSIINTQTGEIDGDIQAVKDYIQAWEDGQKKMIAVRALAEQEQALANKKVELVSYEIDYQQAEIALKEFEKAHPEFAEGYKNKGKAYLEYSASVRGSGYKELIEDVENSKKAFEDQSKAVEKATEKLERSKKVVESMPGEIEQATEATDDWSDSMKEAGAAAVASTEEALKALADYVQGVRDTTATNVSNALSGFEEIKTAKQLAEEAANKVSDLKKELQEAGKTDAEIEIKLNEENAQVTLESLRKGLQSQLDYIKEYQDNLKKAKEIGVSDTVLAQLSDGSQESAQQLYALVEAYQNWNGETQGIPKDIEELNRLYEEVEKGKETFTDVLTRQQLAVDETYQEMVKSAQEAIGEMDLGEEAKLAMADTVSGLATGINEHVSEVSAAVDSILSELNRLNGFGINISLGSFGSINFSIPQFETGLNNVPYDGFLASLHAGEGILTAEENRVWQRFKNGDVGSRNVDYDALGGVMRDNVHAGGNVYLDGRTVGSVISDIQGAQYRNLKRSGWQA